MIPPWPSPYGPAWVEQPTPLPYHLRPVDQLRADEPWIGALYLDGPTPAAAGRPSPRGNPADGAAAGATQTPPGPSATTATGRPGGHQAGPVREGTGHALPQGAGVLPPDPSPVSERVGRRLIAASHPSPNGDRDEAGLPADRTVRPAPAVLSAPSTAGAGRHRHAERPGAAGAVAVPGRAVLRSLEVWVPRLVGLALLFAVSFAVGVVAAVTFAAYGRR